MKWPNPVVQPTCPSRSATLRASAKRLTTHVGPLIVRRKARKEMEASLFSEIQDEFMNRAQQAVYCNVATVDLKNRPRSRVMHVVWDGPIGWVITSPKSHKTKHLAANPHVSLAYISDSRRPMYIDCKAAWEDDTVEMQRVWELHKSLPPPLGFDPTPHYGSIRHEHFGLLRFVPWRIELAELGSESLIWRSGSIDIGG